MESLYHKLVNYNKSDTYPFHMPGHKRNTGLCYMNNPYSIDITEINEFDNLHAPQGILKKAMERAAVVYHSKNTYFLINGSTSGILAGISACTKRGDKILMARNCHKSVYNGVLLNELVPIYIYPPCEYEFGINGGISSDEIEKLLIKNTDIKLVVITSPTYEGILSDVEEIAKIVHKHGVPLLVDEAHGAHLGLAEGFPKNSVQKGADIVIHSTHKTLTALTQTALIHLNSNFVDKKVLESYLSIYQTSSPSYLLMASIDNTMNIIEKKGNELFSSYKNILNIFYQNTKKLEKIKILKQENINWELDPSKIVISVKNTEVTGKELCDILRKEYFLEMEMEAKDYVIAMTGPGDTVEGIERLSKALNDIDKKINIYRENIEEFEIPHLNIELSISEAYNKEGSKVLFEKSEGMVSREYAFLYPPGIPLIVPGEVITKEFIKMLKNCKATGLDIKGLESGDLEYIVTVEKR